MNKNHPGHSFGRKKIKTFLPIYGWLAEIWDVETNQMAGFTSVSKKNYIMNYSDVQEDIKKQGTQEEIQLLKDNNPVSSSGLNILT